MAFDVRPFVGKIGIVTFADPDGNDVRFTGMISVIDDATIEVSPESRIGTDSSGPNAARVAVATIKDIQPDG